MEGLKEFLDRKEVLEEMEDFLRAKGWIKAPTINQWAKAFDDLQISETQVSH